jgi:glycolate oxidase
VGAVLDRFRRYRSGTGQRSDASPGLLKRHLYRSDGAVTGDLPVDVVLPESEDTARRSVVDAVAAGRSIVPRGAGTGLSGGAAPIGEATVISLMKLNRILEVDVANRTAWVEPGVRNLDLSRNTQQYGLIFGPDPSSQSACTLGGNIGTNAGGPRCYAVGNTTSHILAARVLLGDGSTVDVGGDYADPIGLDTRSVVVGSEGTLGLVVKALVRLSPVSEATRTVLCAFSSIEDSGDATARIVRSGVNVTSLEMMDQMAIEICERFTQGGLPLEADAMLLCEVEGTAETIEEEVADLERVARQAGAYLVQIAQDEAQAALWWRARKGAFGAVAQLAPNYDLHDGVVPRTRLVEALKAVQKIGKDTETPIRLIAHAGDGNLHPLIPFDASDPAEVERVHGVSEQIMEVCLALGGAVSGEHGIGVTKVHFMDRAFSPVDLIYQDHVRSAFDPLCVMNPGKVLPSPSSCAEKVDPTDTEMWV